MPAEIFIALGIGILAGVFTGITPGVHINLISVILVSISGSLVASVGPLPLGLFVIAMAVTHTFVDTIPSVYLGAPDADMALAALPGHRLLLKGHGLDAVRLTTIGSILSLTATVLLIPILVPILPWIYEIIYPSIPWILISVTIFMIAKEKGMQKRLWGLLVFSLSGVLGMAVLSMINIDQPLFPMLSGLFGIPILVLSLAANTKVPKQDTKMHAEVSTLATAKAVTAATACGTVTGLLPGLGSAQAAIIAMNIVGKIGDYGFLVLMGGINTVNFVFSMATFYTLERARNGAIVAVMDIMGAIDAKTLLIFCAAALACGGVASILTITIARFFSGVITKVNYANLCMGIIIFISVLVLYFSHLIGLLVLITAAAIGMIPNLVNVKRSLAMGCLLVPVIIYFLS